MERRSTYQFPFSRYPAVRIALLLIAGILFYQYYGPPLQSVTILLGSLLSIYFSVEWWNRRHISTFWSNVASLLFMLVIIGFGMFRLAIYAEKGDPETVQLLQLSSWEDVHVSGKVRSITKTTAGKTRWDLSVSETGIDDINSTQSYKARILADELNRQPTLGDKVEIVGTLIPISGKRNPEDFDYEGYLRSQGISLQIKANVMLEVTPNTKVLDWIWWREKALKLVEQNFDQKTAPIAKALLVGYKQDLSAESKTAFARAGLSHIMAVSGLHVGFIVAPFWVLIPYFWTKKYGSQIGLGLLIILLVCYAGITGFSPSVMRASVMAGFLSYGKLFHRINDSINLTAAAAIVLLIVDPSQLMNIGFQLSFAAVLIILLMLPVIQNRLPYWIRVHWYGKPLMVVFVSLVVQFGLYPLQVYYFGEISLVSPLANALFVPLLGLVVPLSLMALFISSLASTIGFIINYPSLQFLSWMSDFVTTASSWDWAWMEANLGSGFIFVFWLFLIFTISAWHIPAIRWKLSILVLASICVLLSVDVIEKMQPAKLTVTYFDVGQGDAALMKTPQGKYILIDAGIWSPGYNSGRSVILPHLRSKGIKKLDAVILSHPHADHIGGILDIMEGADVGVIYNSGYSYDSNLYHNYRRRASEKGIPIKSLTAGDTLFIDPAMLMIALGPDGKIHNSDPNEHSVFLHAIYGESEFLFTGDAGEHQEKRILLQYGDLLNTDVLKVGHHGSKTSSSLTFLQKTTPDIAIVSLAENNKFRHPHREAVIRLGQTKAEILFTSREKAIVLESDGKDINRVYWY